jgi:alcohol dehydrogenase class IV
VVVQFSFQTVSKILFGVDTLEALRQEAPARGSKAFIIAGRHAAREGGEVEWARRLCREGGVESVVFECPPAGEPDLDAVDCARRALGDSQCDLVIALGGGSILDLAKAAAGLAGESAPTKAYFEGRAVASCGAPWIAIPTTAGSGAEATKNAVLTDAATFSKMSIRDDRFFASTVIVDPRLTVSCPPRVTADSGTDALAQAIESYTSLGANPMTDALAFEAARLILRSLRTAYREAGRLPALPARPASAANRESAGLPTGAASAAHLEARTDLALGSLLAGIALANARLGTIHGLAHPLGARWKIPHGRVCATLLAPVMRFNEPVVARKYENLSALVGEPIIGHVERLCAELDIPADFKSCRIAPDELEWVIKESLPSGSLKMNPRPTTAEDLRAIMAPLI